MTFALLSLVALILLSAVFSGSETGIYSLSKVRLAADARRGTRGAGLLNWLASDDSALLVTLLIGNNLVAALAAGQGEAVIERLGVQPAFQELAATALLTPLIFLFGEVLPKDVFRIRPHALLGFFSPLLAAARVLFWPLERLLAALIRLSERLLKVDQRPFAELGAHGWVLEVLREGREGGYLEPRLEALATNAMRLARTPVQRVTVPWAAVEVVAQGLDLGQIRELVAVSPHTRFPVVDAGGQPVGYLHQLEVLASEPGTDPEGLIRPLLELEPSLGVDRALARMRARGARMASVEGPAGVLGLVTLKDLVEEISGELGAW